MVAEPAIPDRSLLWITRSQPGATRLARQLEQAGWPCLIASVLNIEPVALPMPVPEHLDVAVALSEHAVAFAPPALWEAAEQIVAVGARTAAALAARGVQAQVPQVASSEGLLDGPLQDLLGAGRRVALVRGEGGRTRLQEVLQAAGTEVFLAEVYRREAVTAAPQNLAAVTAIVVSSGDGFEAAGRLWFRASQRRDVPVFAPSQRVVDLAAQLGFSGAINCNGADPESVLAALAANANSVPVTTPVDSSQGLTRKQRMSDEQQKSTVDADDSTVRNPEAETAEMTADEREEAALEHTDIMAATVAETAAESDDELLGDVELEGASDSAVATAATEPAAVVAPKKPKSGRGWAFLSLLLALGAAGGAGYLYYELIYKQPFAQKMAAVDDALASASAGSQQQTQLLSDRFSTLEQSLEQLRGDQGSSIENALGSINSALGEQQQRLESTEKSLMDSLNRVANQAPPSQQEWKLAELEYLMRIANHRVLMEKDADGARRLLETADAILAELDDFGLHAVRAQLADEILSLKRLGKNDVQGLFLRLEAVKRGLDGLPLRVPEYLKNPPVVSTAADVEAAPAERSPLTALAERLGTFLQYRELKTKIKPLLAPEEISYLELNLRLMLEQAQLGALRGQTDVFEQSLDNAIDWLDRYLDVEESEVSDIVAELTQLREISVARELPDISGSLRALLSTERSAS